MPNPSLFGIYVATPTNTLKFLGYALSDNQYDATEEFFESRPHLTAPNTTAVKYLGEITKNASFLLCFGGLSEFSFYCFTLKPEEASLNFLKLALKYHGIMLNFIGVEEINDTDFIEYRESFIPQLSEHCQLISSTETEEYNIFPSIVPAKFILTYGNFC